MWEDHPLCRISRSGTVRYRQEDVPNQEREIALDRVTDAAMEVNEYMRIMEQAPILKVNGLEERFKLLANFNDTVLAAKVSKDGVQFVTWDWDFNHKGLSHGHYYEGNYIGAKQDFAARSGLIEKFHLFSEEQLAEVYRCIHETLADHYPITVEREKMLKAVAEQIEYGVPNLDDLVEQSNQREMEVMDEEAYPSMTQQL